MGQFVERMLNPKRVEVRGNRSIYQNDKALLGEPKGGLGSIIATPWFEHKDTSSYLTVEA